MVLSEEYYRLIPQMENLIADLDRLQLPIVAVYVDLALRPLEEIIAGDGADFTPKSDM